MPTRHSLVVRNAEARRWFRWLVLAMAGALALSLVWWALLEPASARADTTELTIPPGTADAVARGAQPLLIPNSLQLGRNGKLIVRNEDSSEHRFGTWTIPSGGSAEITASIEDGQVSCTVHPDGTIDLAVAQRPSLVTTLASALGLGIPVGLILGFAANVTVRLRDDSINHPASATPPE